MQILDTQDPPETDCKSKQKTVTKQLHSHSSRLCTWNKKSNSLNWNEIGGLLITHNFCWLGAIVLHTRHRRLIQEPMWAIQQSKIPYIHSLFDKGTLVNNRDSSQLLYNQVLVKRQFQQWFAPNIHTLIHYVVIVIWYMTILVIQYGYVRTASQDQLHANYPGTYFLTNGQGAVSWLPTLTKISAIGSEQKKKEILSLRLFMCHSLHCTYSGWTYRCRDCEIPVSCLAICIVLQKPCKGPEIFSERMYYDVRLVCCK